MPPKWVFTVQYRDDNCKRDAIVVLKGIVGVKAENDGRAGSLLRDVTVSVAEDVHDDIPGKILAAFGSVKKKSVAFKVKFKERNNQTEAVEVIKALKGVHDVIFEGNGLNGPLIAKVIGDADLKIVMKPRIVLTIFKKYGTAEYH